MKFVSHLQLPERKLHRVVWRRTWILLTHRLRPLTTSLGHLAAPCRPKVNFILNRFSLLSWAFPRNRRHLFFICKNKKGVRGNPSGIEGQHHKAKPFILGVVSLECRTVDHEPGQLQAGRAANGTLRVPQVLPMTRQAMSEGDRHDGQSCSRKHNYSSF